MEKAIYIIREWIGDHREMNTVSLQNPFTVKIALEEVFGVPVTNEQFQYLYILNVGASIRTSGRRGEEVITTVRITRVS